MTGDWQGRVTVTDDDLAVVAGAVVYSVMRLMAGQSREATASISWEAIQP